LRLRVLDRTINERPVYILTGVQWWMVDDNLEGQMATPLEQYRQQYEQLKAELVDIGFVCQGSVLERYTSCGNPNCRC
jgi:hypothetical protein